MAILNVLRIVCFNDQPLEPGKDEILARVNEDKFTFAGISVHVRRDRYSTVSGRPEHRSRRIAGHRCRCRREI